MKLLISMSAVACATGIALSFPAPGAMPNECSYVQSSMQVDGYCFEWATGGCSNCCRHEDQPATVPVCAGGNQFEICTPFDFPTSSESELLSRG